MTSKLKCPVCNHELYQTASECLTYCCLNKDCPSDFKFAGSKEIWQALMQSQCDLANAKEEIEDLRHNYSVVKEQQDNGYVYAVKKIAALEKDLQTALQALKKIESTEWYDSMSSYEIMTFTAMKALEQIEHKERTC